MAYASPYFSPRSGTSHCRFHPESRFAADHHADERHHDSIALLGMDQPIILWTPLPEVAFAVGSTRSGGFRRVSGTGLMRPRFGSGPTMWNIRPLPPIQCGHYMTTLAVFCNPSRNVRTLPQLIHLLSAHSIFCATCQVGVSCAETLHMRPTSRCLRVSTHQ
jgi:hypothetical protein